MINKIFYRTEINTGYCPITQTCLTPARIVRDFDEFPLWIQIRLVSLGYAPACTIPGGVIEDMVFKPFADSIKHEYWWCDCWHGGVRYDLLSTSAILDIPF